MKLLPYGPSSVLAEFDSLDEVMAAANEWRAHGWPQVKELVPAARSVLVVHDGTFDTTLLRPPQPGRGPADGPVVVVPVRYDGADLEEVAATCGLAADEVVELHVGTVYTCAFCGFMPGFSYLVGLHPRLHLPRRATPRTRLPGGSVAIASEFSAVYPASSPGGWHLLGTTELAMWDETRDPSATLPPGTRVRFEAM